MDAKPCPTETQQKRCKSMPCFPAISLSLSLAPFEKLRRSRISWIPLGGYFLNKGSQFFVAREMFPGLRNFAPANQPSPQPFTQFLSKSRKRCISAFKQIKKRSDSVLGQRDIECTRASTGAWCGGFFQSTTQPTKCDVLYGLRGVWQSPRSCKLL